MSTTWFYAPEIAVQGQLPEEEAHHVIKVLRHQVGDLIEVTDGTGTLYRCKIILTTGKKVHVQIEEALDLPPEPIQDIHLAIAPTKHSDRMEWMLEKVVEVGIGSITPIICHHSERKVVKPERWRKVLVSAMKQSRKTRLPILHPSIEFARFLQQPAEGVRLMAHLSDNSVPLREAVQPGMPVTILIGPEGDFSASELSLAEKMNWVQVSLGPYRLRTETAGLVACVQCNFIKENQPLA